MTDPEFMTPIAVGTRPGRASRGVTAIIVGNTGPRQNPSPARATLTLTGPGAIQATADRAAAPARHPYIMRAGGRPARSAAGLIRNRPSVRPSQ